MLLGVCRVINFFLWKHMLVSEQCQVSILSVNSVVKNNIFNE